MAEDSKDWDFNKTEKDTLESLDEIKKFLKGLKGQYGKIRSNLQDYREYNKEAAKDVENNVEKAKKDANPAQLPLKLAERLPSLEEVIKVAVYSQKDRELIFSLIKDMLKVEEDIEKVQRILQDNLEQNAKKYWDDNFKDVLEKIANGEVSNIPVEDQAMVEQVKQTFDDLKEVEELKGLIQVQEDLFKKFEKEEYNRIMDAELKISAEGKLAAEKALQQEQEVFEEVSTNNGDPEEGPADDENPEEGLADVENPEEGPADVENLEDGPADVENPEEGPADVENPEEGSADDDCSNECTDDLPESTANVTNEESGDE